MRLITWAATVLVALVTVLIADFAHADLKVVRRPRADPPMRILRVASVDPACQPNCPEWISAEGSVTPGNARELAKIVEALGGRRLPVLISSHGGSVRDALEMGMLIRSRGLVVAVARTLVANCPERARDCPGARGRAIVDGAFCASACPLILAGGVERLVGPFPMVGVHQITTVEKETEGRERVTTVRKFYEQGPVDRAVQAYLGAMGVGDPVMDILRDTPAASIRWLSRAELSQSHLATGAIDAATPILVAGANGLNGRSFGGDPPSPDLLTAKGAAEGAAGAAASGPTLALSYRRGGGELEVALIARGSDREQLAAVKARASAEDADNSLPLRADLIGALLPRQIFCALTRDGEILVTPAPEASAPEPIVFDLAAMDGLRAVSEEACP